jgi:iron complex outermembrane receptor protein
VEQVVVTAQRREQRLQDVGIAVTVVGSAQLASQGIKDSNDLVRDVPGLKMNAYTPSAVVFNIRGVSQNAFGDEQEPPVAVYQDDSYSSSFISAGFPLFDLQRVEVLRGPQGTLFGRNATGGAIQFISNKPTKDFQSDLTVGTGSYQDFNIQGAVSGPITDRLQARLSGMQEEADGYIKNLDPKIASRGAIHHWAVRGIFAWQPNDQTDVTLNLRYARNPHEHSAGMYAWEGATYNANLQGEYIASGPDFSGYENTALDPQRGGNPFLTEARGPSYTDRSLFGANLKVEFPVGAFRITSITDVQSNGKHYLEDPSASPSHQVNFTQNANVKQASEEVRASGHFGDHELVVGAFAMKVSGYYTASYALPAPENGYHTVYDVLGAYGPYIPDVTFTQDTTSYALFAQDEWTLPNNLKAIFGVRYWNDERKVNYNAIDTYLEHIIFNTSHVYAFNGTSQVTAGINVKPSDADKTFDDYSIRAELDWKPTQDVLVYGSFNRGTKSGGFTLPTATPFAGYEVGFLNGIPFKPEVLNAYEAGIKATLPLKTTLNLTTFYYDYSNYQAFTYSQFVGTVVNKKANETGLEVEFVSHPVVGLTLQGSTSLLDNQVKNVNLPDGTLVNRHLPQTPRSSAQGLARYEFPVGPGYLALQGDVQYTGKFCFSVLCAPVEREEAHTVYNARVSWAPTGKKWEAAFFLNNIGDEIYRVYTYDVAYTTGQIPSVYAKPQTWGVSLTYHFN